MTEKFCLFAGSWSSCAIVAGTISSAFDMIALSVPFVFTIVSIIYVSLGIKLRLKELKDK